MKYVDLFAGCGGLSLGMERAGFDLALAVEKSDMAARTFFHNFIDDASDEASWIRYCNLDVNSQLENKVVVKELSSVLADKNALNNLELSEIDVVVGGPPCQGFSLAGKRNPNDIRNKLPWEFLDFVAETQPKAVVIENVVGMKQKFAPDVESSFEQLQVALAQTGVGYVVQGVEVNAKHYGAPQHRPRLMIIGLRKDIAEAVGVTSTGSLWKSGFRDEVLETIPDLAPVPTVNSEEALTLESAIADLTTDPKFSDSKKNKSYLSALNSSDWVHRSSTSDTVPNNIKRNHNEKTILRFALYQYFSTVNIDSRLLSRIAHLNEQEARSELRIAFSTLQYPSVSPSGVLLADNEEELIALSLSLATKKHSQKVLTWDGPSRTVVTIPDDYVHPSEPRLFTVRELARFQGFPDRFEFLGKETTGAQRRKVEVPQYSQVGNAVSPWLAFAVGTKLSRILGGAGKDAGINS